jgi:hypothetical protein
MPRSGEADAAAGADAGGGTVDCVTGVSPEQAAIATEVRMTKAIECVYDI